MEKGERRKKIISRGTDRLALITGKKQNLNSEPLSKSSSFNDPSRLDNNVPAAQAQHARSSSESVAVHDEKSLVSDDRRHGGDNVPDTVMEHDNGDKVSKGNDPGTVVPNLPKPKQMVVPEVPKLTASDVPKPKQTVVPNVPKPKPTVVPDLQKPKQTEVPNVPKPKQTVVPDLQKPKQTGVPDMPKLKQAIEVAVLKFANSTQKCLGYFLGSISLNEINFSIITTENTRVMCTIVLAALVVVYNVFLPQNVPRPKSLVAHRPMYVLLLTDVFTIATRLAPFAHRGKEDREPQVEEVGDALEWAGAIKLMELGLVLHQTVRALFIDLSFYAAVVVCGLTVL